MIVDDVQFVTFLMLSIPFVIWGMYGFSTWITTLVKVRRGFFVVRWINKNHQENEKLVKPKSNNIEIDKTPYPFSIDPEFYVLRGAKKIITFSRLGESLNQINFKGGKGVAGSPPEDLFNSMLLEAEQVGKILGFRPDILMKLLAVVAAVGAVGAVIGLVVMLGMLNTLPDQIVAGVNEGIKQIPALVVKELEPFLTKPIQNATLIT